MSADDLFKKYVTTLYHFTDRRNLKSIQNSGGLFSWAKLQENQMPVSNPGGNELSHDADAVKGMDRYVHLCLKNDHPMLHRAREEGRIRFSYYLQIESAVLQLPGVRFTNGVSNKTGVQTFSVEAAKSLIDYEVLYQRTDWSDPQISRRLREAKKCEFLIPSHVPQRFIKNLDAALSLPPE